ncbi:hypothetical protein ACFL2Q_14355 [Thermodesulfobacteriota bacterium]
MSKIRTTDVANAIVTALQIEGGSASKRALMRLTGYNLGVFDRGLMYLRQRCQVRVKDDVISLRGKLASNIHGGFHGVQ